jgi:hypothetical protein
MNSINFDPSHFAVFMIPLFFFALIASVILIVPSWIIFKKAGFSPWLAVLMLVPVANIIILYVIAFSQWKVVPVPPRSVTAFRTSPDQTRL